jgi:hypothetical protein
MALLEWTYGGQSIQKIVLSLTNVGNIITPTASTSSLEQLKEKDSSKGIGNEIILSSSIKNLETSHASSSQGTEYIGSYPLKLASDHKLMKITNR